ncbi:MAG: tRNA lysidine(34) synthetase TilS [Proteobacteria bacterium]|nr:tRNA lysidine(34) synthetase TilS [SAR86 cluster bacterium]MDA0344412.1 tRNA lysidine(34) synthetase TilS [Pseudomonadota bacterium]MDA0899432.1 tRNA lysidine(34) synthetase TilS [Pseudomonadota bacterium]
MDFFTSEESSILNNAKQVVVAFSGGPDSTLALIATKALLGDNPKLLATHINHQQQTDAEGWEEICAKVCDKLNISFQAHKIHVEVKDQGFEAAARSARQKIYKKYGVGTVIILGHHANDQAETILFRLFRGTGIKGLSGMKRVSEYEGITYIRPLMALSKDEILSRLSEINQEFILDKTNIESNYSRNYLRNKVIPLIKEKWPHFDKSLNRMSALIGKQNELYESYLAEKIVSLGDSEGLLLDALIDLIPFERAEIIRFWLTSQGFTVPNESQMKEIEKSFFQSRHDAKPVLEFQRDDGQNVGVVLSKYNKYLIAEKLDE